MKIDNEKTYLVRCSHCGEEYEEIGQNIQEDEHGYFVLCVEPGLNYDIEILKEVI